MPDGCGCCCEYVDIFRCEHLASPASATKDLWSTTADLPALTCDALPRPSRIEAANTCQWFASAGRVGGATIEVDIDATAISISAQLMTSEKGTELVEVGILDNTVLARREVELTDEPEWVYTGFARGYPERMFLGSSEMNVFRDVDTVASNQFYMEVVSAVGLDGVHVVTAITPREMFLAGAPSSLLINPLVAYGEGGWPLTPLGGNVRGYAKTPPTEFAGNACGAIKIYRDGVFVKDILATYGELSLTLSNVPGNADLSGDGTYDDPITGKVVISTSNPFSATNRFSVKPNVDGTIVAKILLDRDQGIVATAAGDVVGGTAYSIQFSQSVDAARVATIEKIYLAPRHIDRLKLSEGDRSNMTAQGSYLIVAKHDDTCEFSEHLSTPNPLVCFTSFVVMTERPAAVVDQLDDSYQTVPPRTPSVPKVWSENLFQLDATATTTTTDAAGKHYTDTIARVFDAAGNQSFAPLVRQYTYHVDPGPGERGAASQFSYIWDQTASQDVLPLPILQRPLPWVDLTFDRPVSGVTAAMISIVGNVPPDGDSVTIEPVSVAREGGWLNRYRVTLPSAAQAFNTQWLIVFSPTPAIGVWANDVRLQEFAARAAFPSVGTEKVVYADKSNGKEYLWDGSAYDEVSNSDYEEVGKTRLKARLMWAIGKDKSIGRDLIDTSSDFNRYLNCQASLTTTTSFVPPEPEIPGDPRPTLLSRIRSTEQMALLPKAGQFRQALPLIGRETFVPRLPNDHDTHSGPAAISYYGLTTTIHPAPPAAVWQCAAPSEAQKHSSILFGTGDLRSITLSIDNSYGDPMSTFSRGSTLAGIGLGVLFFDWRDKTELYSVTCEADQYGVPISQNVWYAEDAADMTAEAATSKTSTGVVAVSPPVEADIKNVEVVIVASRSRLTYPGLMTTTMGQLVIQVLRRWRIEYVVDASLKGPFDSFPSIYREDGQTLVLTKNQEIALMAGDEVLVESDAGTIWKLLGTVA